MPPVAAGQRHGGHGRVLGQALVGDGGVARERRRGVGTGRAAGNVAVGTIVVIAIRGIHRDPDVVTHGIERDAVFSRFVSASRRSYRVGRIDRRVPSRIQGLGKHAVVGAVGSVRRVGVPFRNAALLVFQRVIVDLAAGLGPAPGHVQVVVIDAGRDSGNARRVGSRLGRRRRQPCAKAGQRQQSTPHGAAQPETAHSRPCCSLQHRLPILAHRPIQPELAHPRTLENTRIFNFVK